MRALSSGRRWVVVCLGVYVLAVALIVLTPVSYSGIVGRIGDWLRFDLGFTEFGYGWVEFVANVAMFVPLGFLLTLFFARAWYGVVLSVVISAGVELVQIVIPDRQASIRDVIANVLGAVIGAILASLVVLVGRARRARRARRVAAR